MKSGDTVRVHVKVREGDKERIQVFEGVVIGLHRGGTRASFTVRKVSFGQGVERIFPLHSPTIQKVEVMRSAKVRRAKLYYLRELKGKAARMRDVARPKRPSARTPRRRAGTPSGDLPERSGWLAFPPCARWRTRCGASGSAMSPASTKWAAAAWPVRSWPARWCSTRTATSPASATPRWCRRRARAAVRAHHAPRRRLGGRRRRSARDRPHQHPSGLAARHAARRAGAGAAARHRAGRRVPRARPADGAARRSRTAIGAARRLPPRRSSPR